jgi:outer membrane protein
MSVLKTTIVLGGFGLVLAAAPALAQTPPAAQQPAQQTPAPQQPAQPAEPPRPFPEGARIAYVDIQAIASSSAEGRAASGKIDELRKKKTAELTEKNKQLQGLQTKLQQGGTVLSDQARLQLEKEITKAQRDIQLFQEDAQTDIEQLQNELQAEFQRRLNPIIQQVAQERGLHMLLSIRDSGAVWADTGLDLSEEVVKRFDAASKTAAEKK